MVERLPIESLQVDFMQALHEGPVVITAPTGSGKSTQIPRWCRGVGRGRVLVVEPRRVACRGLAQRVAGLEETTLGDQVGYQVREDSKAGENTKILFATPGIVLRMSPGQWASFDTIILDEFHERHLDVDLLLALLRKRCRERLVVMSATLDGERVAGFLNGIHLHGEGRIFPVKISYFDSGNLGPDVRGLEQRVLQAIDHGPVGSECGPDGVAGIDVLVFLPGKGEIAACAKALRNRDDLHVLELHGGLSLERQSRIFKPTGKRKVVLATNVAETSITVPGIGLVVDSGLARQTRYHRGRGFLALVPIAQDSAEQRAGRAGRTGPGYCVRLWSKSAQLQQRTAPEVFRESLVPLVLAAAACHEKMADLQFLDPPLEHSLAKAVEELECFQSLDAAGRITPQGLRQFSLPVDVPLSRWLLAAKADASEPSGMATLEDLIDLVAVLTVGRALWKKVPRGDDCDLNPEAAMDSPDAFAVGCDVMRILRTLRQPASEQAVVTDVIKEAKKISTRLRQTFDCSATDPQRTVDRKRLAMTVLAADPRTAFVARHRDRRTTWANGGTEFDLGRQSLVHQLKEVEALVAIETRALGLGGRDKRILITCAMPVLQGWLLEAGLGRERLGEPRVEGERVVANIERVFARRVLGSCEEVPQGQSARKALAQLFNEGQIFPESFTKTRERLEAAALAFRLAAREDLLRNSKEGWMEELHRLYGSSVPNFESWVEVRLTALGVESGEDYGLLSAEDLLAPDLPLWIRDELDRRFPRALSLPGAKYEVEYALERSLVLLRQVTGRRMTVPPLNYLPPFHGLKLRLEFKGQSRLLR